MPKPTVIAITKSKLSSCDGTRVSGAHKNQKQSPRDSGRTPVVRLMYGLRITSWLPLPEVSAEGPVVAEVEIREGSSAIFSEAMREVAKRGVDSKFSCDIFLPDGSTYARWSGLFDFLISGDGRTVYARPLGNTSSEVLQTYLLGQVLSFVLLKVGIEPLHASSVVIKKTAVAFMGDCGFGKSTLAAAFLDSGYPLLTDDLLVLRPEERGFFACAGVPRIKLFPENAKNVLGPGMHGTPMNHLTRKLIIPLRKIQVHNCAVPLAAIYALAAPDRCAKRNSVQIRTLSPRRAFVELTRNTFNSVVRDPGRLQRHFAHMSALATRVPVKLISYPRKPELLPAVREAILEDLAK